MAYKNIAIGGATGNIGPVILQHLLDAGFNVTVLTRPGSEGKIPSSAAKIVTVDYESKDSIVEAIKGNDALVSAIPAIKDQKWLVDAAIAAGIKYYVASEYGSDVAGDERVANLPVFAAKKTTGEYLKANEDKISYNRICNGLFLDWGISNGFWVNGKGVTRYFDGGEHKHSSTTLADIAKTVVASLKNPEKFHNRAVYVQSAVVSQKQLLGYAKEIKPDHTFELSEETTEQLEKSAYDKLAKGDYTGMFDMVGVTIFSPVLNTLWPDKNDNELVGIKELTEAELKQLVADNL